MKTVHFGSFDMANFGDALYPLLLQKIIGETTIAGIRDWDSEIGGFHTKAIESCSLDKLIIGGGDILRNDTKLLKNHFGINTWPESLKHGFGLPNAIYISCGVPWKIQFDLPYKFMWVRDYQSQKNLGKQCLVAPDLCHLVADYFPMQKKENYILLQCICKTQLISEIIAHYKKLNERIILVPGQWFAGDFVDMSRLAESLDLEFCKTNVIGILEAIASAKLVITTSLHFSICAASYGVPFKTIQLPNAHKLKSCLALMGATNNAITKSVDAFESTTLNVEKIKQQTREALDQMLNFC